MPISKLGSNAFRAGKFMIYSRRTSGWHSTLYFKSKKIIEPKIYSQCKLSSKFEVDSEDFLHPDVLIFSVNFRHQDQSRFSEFSTDIFKPKYQKSKVDMINSKLIKI